MRLAAPRGGQATAERKTAGVPHVASTDPLWMCASSKCCSNSAPVAKPPRQHAPGTHEPTSMAFQRDPDHAGPWKASKSHAAPRLT